MQPAIVMPIIDPEWRMFPHLEVITGDLKQCFERAYLTITPSTRRTGPEVIARLEADPFFRLIYLDSEPVPGDVSHFLVLYQAAAVACPAEQVLHLCFPDRVSFALRTAHRAAFMADMQAVTRERTPLIFHRSLAAWETHPRNYRDAEQMVTTAGEWLFGKTLDFAWCHVAFCADQLLATLPHVTRHDLALVAEMILPLIDSFQTQEVEWLSWEDPFILARDARELKAEREHSQQETLRRLAYVIPMLELLSDLASR
jgi:hypothetical protein